MKLVAYLAGLMVLLASQAVFADDYYVAGNGDDSNPGTLNAPWQTIAKANKTLRAGDTVFIRGGEYKESINPGASGKPSAPIRYQAYQEEKVVLTSPPADAKGKITAIRLRDRSYIIVEGLKIDGKRLSKSGKESELDHFITFDNAHHNEISNCHFQYANGYAGVHLHSGSSYNRFINNSFDAVGTNHVPSGFPNAGDDIGDIFVIKNSSHNVLENNKFTRGGHNTLDIVGSYNVLRGNTFDGAWTGTGSPGARAAGDLSGNAKFGVPGPRGFNLFEFNIIKNAAPSSDDDANAGMKVQGYNQIVRGNYFYDNIGTAVLGATRVGNIERNEQNHIYNNTFYNNANLFVYHDYGNSFPFNGNVWKNNLVAATKDDVQVIINFTNLAKKEIDGTTIVGNMFDSAGAKMRVKVQGSFVSGDFDWMGKRYPTNIHSNRAVKMTFRDTAARSPAGFNVPAGSPAIDSGMPLTETNSAGSGKVLRVHDARYFYDGFGIPGEIGDTIVVGDSPAVRITSVDYDRNEISLSTSISWPAEAPVVLAYAGAGLDVGAHELYAQYENNASNSKAQPKPPHLQLSSN